MEGLEWSVRVDCKCLSLGFLCQPSDSGLHPVDSTMSSFWLKAFCLSGCGRVGWECTLDVLICMSDHQMIAT